MSSTNYYRMFKLLVANQMWIDLTPSVAILTAISSCLWSIVIIILATVLIQTSLREQFMSATTLPWSTLIRSRSRLVVNSDSYSPSCFIVIISILIHSVWLITPANSFPFSIRTFLHPFKRTLSCPFPSSFIPYLNSYLPQPPHPCQSQPVSLLLA